MVRMNSTVKNVVRHFTLIELLVVTVILGVLSSIIITSVAQHEVGANNVVREKEMADIFNAFHRMECDCQLTDAQLDTVISHGLWPLFWYELSTTSTTCALTTYDRYRATGWRGRYMIAESSVTINSVEEGQCRSSTDSDTIKVILNPWGNHYRVLCPKDSSGNYRYNYMTLVCPGVSCLQNGEDSEEPLETLADSLNNDGEIEAEGDDLALLLRLSAQ